MYVTVFPPVQVATEGGSNTKRSWSQYLNLPLGHISVILSLSSVTRTHTPNESFQTSWSLLFSVLKEKA